ncbi:patatin-like phospholipase family protein [Heyndrickxia acidicola]|uniref:Patatin-like phospholipase family protein n=1 Tax=Heyndrickxia acidicola TaxID=209389 RepID=A0ABU6MC11_9BACI|nr:patatin-like phospholipase family protein [Heyndrickxia acidicola]MED1202186.1 patatin-like phospholipase family protein [Heyndrickxia acidicola]
MVNPKVGIALGSGGARGFAHLGVLKALEAHSIPVDYIAGSSMGALVGAIYCTGQDIERLVKVAAAFKRKYFLDFTVPKMGFISGKRVKEFVRVFTHNKRIEELKVPIAIVATDLKTGEKVVFREGPIAEAVRASISIPGIFIPEKVGGRLLVDGGVIERVPVTVAKELGADIVIGVDVSGVKRDAEISNIYDVIMQSIDILQWEMEASREKNHDIMIQPDLEKFSSIAFTNTEEIIKIGEEEAEKRLPDIMRVIEEWKVQNSK